MMKKKLPTIIFICIFVLGLLILLYPTISDRWNRRTSSRVIASYDEALALLGVEDYSAWWEEAERYNGQIVEKGILSAMTEEDMDTYLSTIDPIGTGMMGYIDIEKIDVHLPIYHTVDEGVLQIAVGHLPETSLPTGGKGNHIALSGHRGLPSATLFTDLDELVEGDLFVLTVLDRVLTYEVDQIRIVNPDEVDDLEMDPQEDYCTLITCTPYGVNSHRMLVRGHRTSNVEGVTRRLVASDATAVDTFFVATAIAVPVLIALVIAVFVTTSRKKVPSGEAEEKKNGSE